MSYLTDFPPPSRKFSPEEREWLQRMRATGRAAEAWKPPKDAVLTEGTVERLTPKAQWAYKANASTRTGRVARARKRAPARETAAQLRARVRELEAEVAELTGLLDAATMPVAA